MAINPDIKETDTITKGIEKIPEKSIPKNIAVFRKVLLSFLFSSSSFKKRFLKRFSVANVNDRGI